MASQPSKPDVERLLFLTDGVFAIAVTLLILDIRLPEGTTDVGRALLALRPELIAYATSFLVIYSLWTAHRRVFRFIAHADLLLTWLNGLFLLGVAFLPLPVSVYGGHSGDRAAVILYAVCMAATSLMLTAIWFYAISRPALLHAPLETGVARATAIRSVVIPTIFMGSIALAALSVRVAAWSWALAVLLPPLLVRFAGDGLDLLPSRASVRARPVADEDGSQG